MRFGPYVFVQTSEKKPSSIANAAWCGNQMKYIYLDLVDLASVQTIVQKHFKDHQGKCPLYDNITGYRFVSAPTESIVLDTDGNELRRENGTFWPKSISMEDPDRVTPT